MQIGYGRIPLSDPFVSSAKLSMISLEKLINTRDDKHNTIGTGSLLATVARIP